MPIYQYKCSNCGAEIEVVQKMSDEPLTICHNCNEPTLIKQLSAGSFILKGSGWFGKSGGN